MKFAVEGALTSTFSSEHMSKAVDYLLDQHRLSRRLDRVPTSARKLLLHRKDVIYSTMLAMDDNDNGEIGEEEFLSNIHRLGLPLRSNDARDLFIAFDLDGSGVVRPEQLEKLLFGERLSQERRSSLHATAQLRKQQWQDQTATLTASEPESRAL